MSKDLAAVGKEREKREGTARCKQILVVRENRGKRRKRCYGGEVTGGVRRATAEKNVMNGEELR